jgi:hypothetical protein
MHWTIFFFILLAAIALTILMFASPRSRDQRLDRDWAANPGRDDAPAEIDAIAGAHRGAENVEAYKRMTTDERARDD